MSTLKSNNEDMTINADGASSEIILQQNGTEIGRIGSGFAGTSGQVLTSNGAGAAPTMQATAGGLQSMQVFTTSGTWTKPAGITKIKVTVVGGGGGGSGASYYRNITGSGGQAGGAAIKIIDVSAISSETITIGAGGTAGAVVQYDQGAHGGTGGTSSFGAHCSATGGSTGVCYESYRPEPGSGSGGDINIRGGQGSFDRWAYNVPHTGSQYRSGGQGGSSIFGGGGRPATKNNNATNNAGYGAGGGGGWNNGTSTSKAGGAGGAGIIIVEEYL